MREGWRNELFKIRLPDFMPNPLGFPMAQAQGQRVLGVCCRTWNRWEKVALKIPEYKLTHVKLKGLAKERSIPINQIPIVPYQVWVIGKIGEYFSLLPNGTRKIWIVEETVKFRASTFTRQAYLAEQERFTSSLIEESLCSR